MTISELYTQYKVMPKLQEHMLKVASVAKVITDNLNTKDSLNQNRIISACLVHDIGKIVEFTIGFLPNTLGDKSVEYWEEVQKEYIEKYGTGRHATTNIVRELGLDEETIDLINHIGFMQGKDAFESNNLEKMICCYADQRVSPYGITSLEYRMEEGRIHYKINKKAKLDREEDQKDFEFYSSFLYKIQDQIFQNCKLKPQDITDESSKETIEELKNYQLKVKLP